MTTKAEKRREIKLANRQEIETRLEQRAGGRRTTGEYEGKGESEKEEEEEEQEIILLVGEGRR